MLCLLAYTSHLELGSLNSWNNSLSKMPDAPHKVMTTSLMSFWLKVIRGREHKVIMKTSSLSYRVIVQYHS
jgi:hypothetical protein